ncbi:MAG: pyruvate:ferredoxin (flavodoxin) oxidoreductase, partial [Erysipelotrichaceae bacterium]|nr:pyruvate:ferredoxin (flavodoxin) oxidoreductase [Erysipelotrichaceae bacterium]
MKKIFLSIDGNTAAGLASYSFTEIAGIFPITPSSPMAELVDVYASQGKLNYFGEVVKVVEMQSEGGAAGTVHGALQAGALATTYTASQGLLLMIPNIYKWVGELLPAVLHVSARSLATRSLSIFGDHQDVYAIRQTGITMLCSHSVQEVADLTAVAHLIAIDSSMPMCHFFDGFRTSHEIQKVEMVHAEDWRRQIPMDKVAAFRKRALNPHCHPVTRGGAENDDIYFQGREAQNRKFDETIEIAEKYLRIASELTGREYGLFTYYGRQDACDVIVAMGSVTEVTKEVIDALPSRKLGLLKVHLYRPFSIKHFIDALPKTVKRIAVLDRTKEGGALGEPLYLDVVAALRQAERNIQVYGGRYGLSSKDMQPKDIKAVYDFLKDKPRHNFTVGINDDVTHLSIPVCDFQIENEYKSCLFYGLGSDGTVSANKSSIKIIGEATNKYAQAYFAYDSRKAGGVTRSHLRFGNNPIRSTYYVKNADFISCSLDSYIFKFDILQNLKVGGTFLLNTSVKPKQIKSMLPDRVKCQLAQKKAKFYIINANAVAQELGMGRHTNTILQASFFKLANIIPLNSAIEYMKKYAEKSYSKKGPEVVQMNYKAIDAGVDPELLREIKVEPCWKKLEINHVKELTGDDYFDNYVMEVGALRGDDLPVSSFLKGELLDGTMENNITFKEKRNIADRVPKWHKENCIQCNVCSFVCPHATIRPFLLDEAELMAAPKMIGDDYLKPLGGPNVADYKYRIQVSPMNCVGCSLCVTECLGNKIPGKTALEMVDAEGETKEEVLADYLYQHVSVKPNTFPTTTIKGVSFLKPYMEVSGACAGCGETPYYRLLSQLFGDDLMIANATGCSSIYSGSTPLTPFVKDRSGKGIAWANSLFEDNAEFGFGMRMAVNQHLATIKRIFESVLGCRDLEEELEDLVRDYLANIKNRGFTAKIRDRLVRLIENSCCEGIKEVLPFKDDLVDKSVWIVGGDGW